MSGHEFNENEESGIISQINVTPLVDIMLVLLIIFMLVSSFVAKEVIEVDLPQASTGKDSERKTLSILISKEGDYYLSGKKYETVLQISDELKNEKRNNPQIQVVISADRLVYHGKVVDIIDLIRQLEIYDFAINVEYDEEALRNSQ
jgi:biopolymer transport protein ExbD